MTKRQLEIYNFIKNFIKVNGVSPSYNEIVTGVGLKVNPMPTQL